MTTLFPNCPIDPHALQPPLRTEKFEALYQLVRIGTICQDLSILLIYYVQTVDVTVLVHLAQQFDVLGCKGWLLADTEQKKRDLIENSVALHRLAGTPQALLDAFDYAGFTGLGVIENPCLLYDGTWSYNGEWNYNGKRYDNFMVAQVYDLDNSVRELVRCLVQSWQPARSNFFEPFLPRQYDGSWSYDGSITYNGKSDNEITDYVPYVTCATGTFGTTP